MRLSLVGVAVLLAACATARPPAATAPASAPSPSVATPSMLPPVPLVTGALKPTVIYPVANSLVEARDS
ncbi:MAG: hypothetical protein ABI446_13225, partial [Gemmatimonadaceae bacterium]